MKHAAKCRRWSGILLVVVSMVVATKARARPVEGGMQSAPMFTGGIAAIGVGIAGASLGPLVGASMCADSCPGESIVFLIGSPALGGASVVAGIPLAMMGAARPDRRSRGMVGGGVALITLGTVTIPAGATIAMLSLGSSKTTTLAAVGIAVMAGGNGAIAGGIGMYAWGNEPDDDRVVDAVDARGGVAVETVRLVPIPGGMALLGRF